MKNQMNQKQNGLITKASPPTAARLRDHYSRGQRRVAWLTLFCFFVSPATAFADATETSIGNANTIDGIFTENTEANTTFDQSTQSAVIHWDQMDQQANNTLTFIQSKNESVLNQAKGVTASVFRGMVKCGGECIFANEAGVTFADGSYLDVGRLVAVAGTVNEDDFRADKLHATGVTGEVTHFGETHANSAVLIGARISNGGELYVGNGSLTAVVGNEIWITEHDSNVIIQATIPDAIPGTTRGSSDRDAFNEQPAIDNTGTIRAQEIALEADSGLVEVSGDSVLDATSLGEGGVGGSIKVLGDYVAIADNATLDASGHSGGGEVLVGGDRAGADGTHTSQGTYVGKSTTLRADATHSGDGGKVIVWSDKTTRSYGEISARGGVLSGNGGFVETSGLEHLDVTNSPLVHARSGNADDRGGEWLLDPFNIDIVSSCTGDDCLGDDLQEERSYDPALFFSGTVTSDNDETVSQIEVGLIKQVLLTGSNVTITTEGAGSDKGSDIGDINFLADADLRFGDIDGALPSTEATLTLLAANNLTVDADIDNDATDFTLNLDFRANSGQPEKDADDGARGNEYFGDLDLNGEIHTGGGSADLSGVNVTLHNEITTEGGSAFVLAEGGDAVLTAAALLDTSSAAPDGTGGSATVVALARVTEEIPADPTDAPTRDDVLGGNVHVEEGAQISTGGGSVTVTGGNDDFSRLNDALGGNVTFDGMIDSGGGRVTLEAHRAFNTSNLETTHFGGRVRIDRNSQLRSNGGRINIGANLESLTSGGDDGRTRVQIFGEVDSRVYDAGILDADKRGGDIEVVSGGFQTAAIEVEDLRTVTGDSLIATNGGDFVSASRGTTKVISGTIDTQFTGAPPAVGDGDAIKSTISIGSIGLTSLQATPNDIALLADGRINLTGGLDGQQRLRIDTTRGNITISAEAIQLAAGNGPDGNSTAQVDLSRADSGLQFTNGAGNGNPLDFTIGQDASIDASNLPDTDMFQNGMIDVDSFGLRSFDGELTLAGIDITSSDSLSLGARTGINIDDATTNLNVAGATLNVEVYESFTVESSHATEFNEANELNISAGVIEGIRNTSEEAGLTIAASLTSGESMRLRGGVGGSGDVTFEGTPTLTTQDLTLWAGDGGANNIAPRVFAIDSDTGTGLVDFTLIGDEPAFTLRQSASITNNNIPNASQFMTGADVDGVNYTLRSDAGAIGGEETIDSTKLVNTFLSLHARNEIATNFTDGDVQVRGLDIGGLGDFTYTYAHNDSFDVVDGGNETKIVIRAGMGGSGNLTFGGALDDAGAPPDTFEISADEIRLVAGDGLGGSIGSRIVLPNGSEADDVTPPVFTGRMGSGPVKRFVFRQDDAINQNDLARVDEHFDDKAPGVYVVHSDYDSDLDLGDGGETRPIAAIVIDDFDGLVTATDRLILSGESVTIAKRDGTDLNLVSDFDQTTDPASANFELEVRTTALTLEANDNNDLNAPVGITLDESRLTITDYARNQTEDEAAQSVPVEFDIDATADTTPTAMRLFQERKIDVATLTSLRTVLNASGGITSHDNPANDPELSNDQNERAMTLFLETEQGNIELDPTAVAALDLRLTLRDEDANIEFNRDADAETSYDLANLSVNTNGSLVFGGSTFDPIGALNINSDSLIQIVTGAGGGAGDLSFGEMVNLKANQMLLQAGIDGALAGNHESPKVDLSSNTVDPTFTFFQDDDNANTADTFFEIRQDAGYTDDASRGNDGDSMIVRADQILGEGTGEGTNNQLGLLRLISDGGDITVSNLSETFTPSVGNTAGNIANVAIVALEAGIADPLLQGTITIGDTTATDTDLTLYEGMDLTANEIILEANGEGAVVAHDSNILFRESSISSDNDPLRFTIRHDQADICEGAEGCSNDGALPSLDQFVSFVNTRPVNYSLISTSGAVDLTSQIASKLVTGTNARPRRVDLTLIGNDINGTSDVRITANILERDADVQLESLVIGEVNNHVRTEIKSAGNESVHVATVNDQRYYGAVNIVGSVEVTGDRLHFVDNITSTGDSTLDVNLVANVREVLRIDADVDLGRGPDTTLSTLRINLDPDASPTARLDFGGDGIEQTVTAERVEIFATEESDLDAGGDFFPSGARRSPVATVGKRRGDLRFDVDTFRVSEGEKISVGGELTIGDENTMYAAVGDLSALDITVIADQIDILLREAGDYLRLDGSTGRDAGTDIVANTVNFDGNIGTVGNGRTVAFGIAAPFDHDEDLARFPVAQATKDGSRLTASDFDWNVSAAPPDLHPEGAVTDDFSSVYFDEEIVPAPDAWRAEPEIPTDDTELASIGIDLRSDSPRTLRGRMERAAISDDVGSDIPDRQTDRVEVSISRVIVNDAKEVASRYERLFGAEGENAERVKATLSSALDRFRETNGSRRVLGFEFRRYVRNRPSSQLDAYVALEALDTLFSYHRNLGLTPGEYNRVQRRWLESIKPEGLSVEELAEAVHPSRFIRGSDILDVFGQ